MTAGPPEAQRSAPRTAGEMLALGRAFLERRGADAARAEAELLVAHALGLERLQLFLQLDRPVLAAEIDRARELLVRRGGGEPVAYITGTREFYGRPFRVGPGVLVPRPETELLVDLARERAAELGPGTPRIGDLGTGSGCIAITLALELPAARVFASDVSETALTRARANAETLEAEVCFVLGDGPEALLESAAPLDLLLCNPPYVDPVHPELLANDVRDHEPREALFAPEGDPDHWVRRILDETLEALTGRGLALVELGIGQGPRVLALAAERHLAARLHTDYEGIPRVLEVASPGT